MPDLLRETARLTTQISSHGLAEYPAGATFGPRTLHDYEFVWIVSGEVVWESDGRDYPVPPGTILLARPGMRDAFRWDPQARTRHGFVHFTMQLNGAILPPPEAWPMTLRLPDGDVLRPLLQHLAWLLWAHPPGAQELIPGILRQALLAYISGAVATASESADHAQYHPAIQRVLAQVREAWADGILQPLALDGLARVAGLSRAHLSRLFLQEFGATPVETLRIMRLDHGALLLARTNLRVQAIAEQCGFVNAFHFSRLFRAQYGRSPRTLRQELAAGRHMPVLPLVRIRDLSNQMWAKVGA